MIFSFTQALLKTELLLFILRWGKTDQRGAANFLRSHSIDVCSRYRPDLLSSCWMLLHQLFFPGWFIRMRGVGEGKGKQENQQDWASPVDMEVFAWGPQRMSQG